MLKGKTKSGFAYEVSDETLDDYELFEILTEVDKNPLLVPKMVKLLLGETQRQKLLDHLRDDKGKVSISAVGVEVMEIFESNNKAKNS